MPGRCDVASPSRPLPARGRPDGWRLRRAGYSRRLKSRTARATSRSVVNPVGSGSCRGSVPGAAPWPLAVTLYPNARGDSTSFMTE